MWFCVLFSMKEHGAQERRGRCLLFCAAQSGAAWFVCRGWVLAAPVGMCSSAAAGAFVNPCVPPALLFC